MSETPFALQSPGPTLVLLREREELLEHIKAEAQKMRANPPQLVASSVRMTYRQRKDLARAAHTLGVHGSDIFRTALDDYLAAILTQKRGPQPVEDPAPAPVPVITSPMLSSTFSSTFEIMSRRQA